MKTKVIRLLATGGLMAAVFAPSAAHAVYGNTDPASAGQGSGGGNLPLTGSDSSDLSYLGAGLAVSGGALVVLAGKRRRAAARA